MKTEFYNTENEALNKTDVMQSVILPNELRFGNLLMELTSDDIFKVKKAFFTLLELNLECSRKIPLTKEWLFKFGFIVRYFNEDETKPLYWKVEQNRHIDIYFEPAISAFAFKINSIQYSTPINYVHQLQNLYFSLTGCELTVA